MTLRTARAFNKRVHSRLAAFEKEAYKVIEAEARKIMRDHPRCASFTMANGSYSFHEKKGGVIGEWGPFDYPNYLGKFDDMMFEFSVVNVTGMPMKIVGHDGKLLKDW